MPVVALPPSNTERWWLVYTVNADTHRMQMRTGDNALTTNVVAAFGTVLNDMSADLASLVPVQLEFSFRGSDVRNIVPWTGAPSYGLGNFNTADKRDVAISFVGRSAAGHKSRMHLFGYKIEANGDYRTTSAESTNVATTVAFLNSATGAFLGIDGAKPVWKGYVNTKVNDHWVKKHRG